MRRASGLTPIAVERMDRSELIAALRDLEQQRSAWELRIEAAAEREELCRDMVQEAATLVSMLFKREYAELAMRADSANNVLQAMNELLRKADML